MSRLQGIHHVSATVKDPQRSHDFYVGTLGMRLVKRTVNFDDSGTWHLYFGDSVGTPGSLMTLFPWPAGKPGRQGVGQVATTAFSVAPSSLAYWLERFVRKGVEHSGPTRRSYAGVSERVLSFRDPDGLSLELVAHESVPEEGRNEGVAGVPADHAIRGLHGVTIWLEDGAATSRLLQDTLEFREVHNDGTLQRFSTGDGSPGTLLDVRSVGGFLRGTGGTGTVHHVAWSVSDDATELQLRERLVAAGLTPTEVIDRKYFRSVYFREPGRVLFELATLTPGLTMDETVDQLGSGIQLPLRFEADREAIVAALPPLHDYVERGVFEPGAEGSNVPFA